MTRASANLGVVRGGALYVGALVGPGLLLVPALATEAAGPASIIAWAALIVICAPIAITFTALGIRHPVPGGVATYVEEGFGKDAAAVTGWCFLGAVVLGGPAVALIGGYYVADLTGAGTLVAALVAIAMCVVVFGANAFGLRVSSGVQLALSGLLVAIVAVAVGVALPARGGEHWLPFAPKGWWAIGTAASILIWLFVGWEAMAQLVSEFKDPERDLARAAALAFAVIAVLYAGLGVATIAVTAKSTSKVPLADLLAVGFGRTGRDVTAVLAVALTMGTMNVYVGGSSRLAAALGKDGYLPAWLAQGKERDVPRRPLALLVLSTLLLLGLLGFKLMSPQSLVRATSACFCAVYLFSLAAAGRILSKAQRVSAVVAFLSMAVVTVFSSWFLFVPLALGLGAVVARRFFAEALAGSKRAGPEQQTTSLS